ncbi:NUDIX domain-containing protein [Gemmatimonadota bacterium Y43]|uniref:(deoxy)nucleoside triphosphate pyrophosphohydrolase n=1 Tax=Gaopeijia maritima TaxID=3119007 RepID=UPI0032917511
MTSSTPAGHTPPRSNVPVVAAVVEREGRYLVGRRPAHKRHGDLWEFPGGKLEPDESWASGASRELDEELGVVVASLGATLFERRDAGSPYVIRFIETEIRGTPRPLEHSEVGWFTLDELEAMPLAPSDAAFVRHRRARAGST